MSSSQCPLCSSTDTIYRFEIGDFALRCCNGCDLLFIDPYPYETGRQHAMVSETEEPELDITDPETHYRGSTRRYQKSLNMVSGYCEDATSILDVGCGTGRLLKLLEGHPGLRRVGIELNEGRAEFARKITRCEVHQVPFERFSSDTAFDLITFMDVLSHIPSLDEMFSAIDSLLSAEGKVVIKTGELDSHHVEKGANDDWSVPSHVHFLGLRTIDAICERYGLISVEHHRVPFSQTTYSIDRFRTPGRSRARNLAKTAVAFTPFALRALRWANERRYPGQIYSSCIVLGRKP